MKARRLIVLKKCFSLMKIFCKWFTYFLLVLILVFIFYSSLDFSNIIFTLTDGSQSEIIFVDRDTILNYNQSVQHLNDLYNKHPFHTRLGGDPFGSAIHLDFPFHPSFEEIPLDSKISLKEFRILEENLDREFKIFEKKKSEAELAERYLLLMGILTLLSFLLQLISRGWPPGGGPGGPPGGGPGGPGGPPGGGPGGPPGGGPGGPPGGRPGRARARVKVRRYFVINWVDSWWDWIINFFILLVVILLIVLVFILIICLEVFFSS